MAGEDLAPIVQSLLPQLSEEDTAVIAVHLPRLKSRLDHLSAAFPERTRHAIAIKTHPHPRMLAQLVAWGYGLEAASIEEVNRALEAGCPAERIVFDSPVKTRGEIGQVAYQKGMLVNVNTLSELGRFPADATCTLGIRINPQVHTGSPELFNVSSNESKFGVPLKEREALLQAVLDHPVTALHMHSGSQMKDLQAQRGALEALGNLALEANGRLQAAGLARRITTLDIGGGLPSEPLRDQTRMQAYGALVAEVPSLQGFALVTEFGQWVHAEAGLAFSRVEYVIHDDQPRMFIHLGADFFMRDAYTAARPFPLSVWTASGEQHRASEISYDIAGPLCFAGDYLAHGVALPSCEEGMWLGVDHTGANTYALWSRHCSRDVPAVYAWDGREIVRWSERRTIGF